jgi:alpha-beta hydrolase superfamily lysophospholipase
MAGMISAALLIAAATAGVPALPPRPPDATYTYVLSVSGTTLGTSTIGVDGSSAGTIVVKENANFLLPQLTGETTMRYDAATLHETSYGADLTVAAGTRHLEITFASGPAHIVTSTGLDADIPAAPSAPLEIIGDNLIASAIMLPALVHASGAQAFTVALLSGRSLIAKVSDVSAAARPADVPATDLSLGLDLNQIHEVFWYDPATYLVHDVVVPQQQAEFRLTATAAADVAVATPAPLPTALPTPFPHFTSRDVHFTSADGTVLAGTLTVPDRGRPPYATVVLVHGSGAADRDELIGVNPVFLQLSNALSNDGYAVLRYDKRGVGQSGGKTTLGTRDELLDDVRAAYGFARAQPKLDPKHVFLLGHSEGGELVPTVAVTDPSVPGIILLAPPALPLSQVLMEQALAGVAPDQQAAARAREQAIFTSTRQGHDSMRAWLRSSLDIDPAVDIARVRAPVLILQGTADAQVLAADLPRLVTAARAHNHDVTVRTFPGDNHLFDAAPPGVTQTPFAALRQYLTVPAWIDARVLRTIESWLAVHDTQMPE